MIAQIAGSTLFLAAALLFVRSFWNTAAFVPGFDAEHTLVLELNPATFGYDAHAVETACSTTWSSACDDIPGIEQAALADRAPFSVGFPKNLDISVAGEDCARVRCRTAIEFGVSPGHFAAIGLPLEAGRELTDQEVRERRAGGDRRQGDGSRALAPE